MDPEEGHPVDLSSYWNVDDAEYDSCDCPGPPPQFMLPPPPSPPSHRACHGGDESDLRYCHLEPVEAEFTQAAFPSLPIIAVCSSIVLVALLVASFLLWKHKKKVQNFLPCKNEHQGHCDLSSSNGITYDDVLINHHPTRLPNHHGPETHTLTPIELLDVKYGSYGPPHLASLTHSNFTFHPATKEGGTRQSGKNKEHFNPIYEEVSGGSDGKAGESRSYDSDIEDSEAEARTVASEDEFAEDELSLADYPKEAGSRPPSGTSSLQGSTGGDLCRDAGSDASEGGNSETRELKHLFRHPEESAGKGRGSKKHMHSLERNKNGHPSEGLQAKQNYYLSKSMLAPDLAYPPVGRQGSASAGMDGGNPSETVMAASMSQSATDLVPYAQSGGRLGCSQGDMMPPGILHAGTLPALRQHSSDSPPPPPYTPGRVREAYNSSIPFSTRAARLPGALLSELNQRFTGAGPQRSQQISGPGSVFTLGHEEAYPLQLSGPRSRAGDVPVDFSTFHPTADASTENIYASIDEDGPFTIDVGCSRGGTASRKPEDRRNSFGRAGANTTRGPDRPVTVPKETSKGKLHSQNIPPQRTMEEEPGAYGDIRPLYDSRTVCT